MTIKRKYYLSEDIIKILSITPENLDRWAKHGEGPPYIRPGKRRLYPIEKFELWERSQKLKGDTSILTKTA